MIFALILREFKMSEKGVCVNSFFSSKFTGSHLQPLPVATVHSTERKRERADDA